jgi:SRSO17 transposase
MGGRPVDGWEGKLERWLGPFLARLRRKEQRRWAPVYLRGLILPGERKSVEPMAARVAPGDTQQLHHFVSTAPWATAPLEEELVKAADRLVGGPDAVLVVDDTALVKQGRHSVGVKRRYRGQLGERANCQSPVSLTLARAEVPVGVKRRYRGQLGERANCQSPVSLTLARAEVPVGVGLRPFLPEDRAADAGRREATGVPEAVAYRPKWRIALDEIDRVLAAGARFGAVLADAGYGRAAEFRAGLAERHLTCAVGVLPIRQVYPAGVTLAFPDREATGRPRKHPVPSAASVGAAELLEARPQAFRAVSWRTGTKGPLKAEFAAVRVRVADGPAAAGGRRLPGDEARLVGEHRASGEKKYYLSNLPADASLETLAALTKARRVCEQLHQRLKDEPGLDHFEGRSWRGLHHHALLCLLALAFLQHLRLGGKKRRHPARARPAAPAGPARRAPADRGRVHPRAALLPALPAPLRAPPPSLKVAG